MAVRTRIRRKRRRKAPAVKRGTNGAQTHSGAEKQGTGLLIGGAHDPAEKAADSLAARALGQTTNAFSAPTAAPVIHRKCAACGAHDKDEPVARQATNSAVTAAGTHAARASSTATQAITSLGAGRPMNKTERGFFEPRFGADFSSVRLHEGAKATNAADSIQAEAFTQGNTITMGRTADRTGTMAHELAHVVQGGSALRRKIIVENSTKRFPGSPKAKSMTNATGLIAMIGQFPGSPKIAVDKSGVASLPAGLCDPKDASQKNPKSKYKVTDQCLCQVVASSKDWKVEFFADKMQGPRTSMVGGERGSATKSTGGKIFMNTPYSKHEYGFYKADGTVHKAAEWAILAHELCGHAAKGDKNDHPNDVKAKLRHGHDEVVPLTNQMRKEKQAQTGKSQQMRPETAAAPNCGESTFRDRGSAAKWDPSSNLARACQLKRNMYIDALKVSNAEKARMKKLPLDKEVK
jgi:hypothetical protein